jgi:sialidase-1
MKKQQLLLIPALILGCEMTTVAAPLSMKPLMAMAAEAAEEAGDLTISMDNGTFTAYNANGKYASHWRSTQNTPMIDIDCGKNNMDVNTSNTNRYLQAWVGLDGSCDYNISVSDGWKITGFSIDVTLVNATQPVTLKTQSGESYVIGTTPTQIKVEGVDVQNALFTLVGENHSVYLQNFVVKYAVDKSERFDMRTATLFNNRNSTAPYRIPAIGMAQNGTLVAVADYRTSRNDIGTGRVDLHLRLSDNNGQTWGEELKPEVFEGNGILTYPNNKAAYGDPCIVGDRESPRMLMMSCAGFPMFTDPTDKHQGIARWYSTDNGKNWTGPDYIDEQFVYKPMDEAGHHIHGFFFASGRIYQSKYIKMNNYYRLYCAGLSQQNNSTYENWVLYSDDFGETWSFLGGMTNSPVPGGNEAKVEELPGGNVLISSRTEQGRFFNIFTFTGNDGVTGSWATKALSNKAVDGLTANNGCNGEIMILPAIRNEDNQQTFIALQSLPVQDRTKVTIFYKDLGDPATYASPTAFARDWDGRYQVSNMTSAYSTMCMQKDNTIAFLYEEDGYNNGYNIVYKRLNLETITSDKYSFNAEYKYDPSSG